MTYSNRCLAVAFCSILLLFTSCTKKKETASCTPVLYGNKSNWTDSNFVFSSVDPVTASTGAGASFVYHGDLNPQGAFNTSDNCYYILCNPVPYALPVSFTTILKKISPGGAVTDFTISSATYYYTGLVYNQVTHKLYCLKSAISGPQQIVELTPSGSAITETILVSTIHPTGNGSVTVDNTSGALYFISGDTATYYLEKYIPGATATTVVGSDTVGFAVIGLRFNINDNILYALRYDGTGTSTFIKINPATGNFTALAPISYPINVEFYSACIDPCNNHYLLSTFTGTGWTAGLLDEYDMSGIVVNHVVTTPYIFEGMDVKY